MPESPGEPGAPTRELAAQVAAPQQAAAASGGFAVEEAAPAVVPEDSPGQSDVFEAGELAAAADFIIPPESAPAPLAPAGAPVILRKLDLRSLFRFSAGFYLFLALVAVIGAAILFMLGAAAGINDTLESFMRSLSFNEFRMKARTVLGWTAVLTLFSAAGLTLLTLLVGLIYNLVCDLTGGIRIVVSAERTKMDRQQGP